MDIDTAPIEAARRHAEQVEADAHAAIREARQEYFRAVADLVEAHGATATGRALGVSRQRVYQLLAEVDR